MAPRPRYPSPGPFFVVNRDIKIARDDYYSFHTTNVTHGTSNIGYNTALFLGLYCTVQEWEAACASVGPSEMLLCRTGGV